MVSWELTYTKGVFMSFIWSKCRKRIEYFPRQQGRQHCCTEIQQGRGFKRKVEKVETTGKWALQEQSVRQ